MAITSHGYTGAVNNVQWAGMAGSLGFDYVAKGPNDCKASAVGSATRTVRIAAGVIAGGGVIDYVDAPVDIVLPNVTTGSRWYLIVADRTWQTTNATVFTYVAGTAVKQLPARTTGFGTKDQQPIALVRIAAGQTIPAEVIDLRVVGSNNGVMVGFDTLALEYLNSVGTVVRIGATEWTRGLSALGGAPAWSPRTDSPGARPFVQIGRTTAFGPISTTSLPLYAGNASGAATAGDWGTHMTAFNGGSTQAQAATDGARIAIKTAGWYRMRLIVTATCGTSALFALGLNNPGAGDSPRFRGYALGGQDLTVTLTDESYLEAGALIRPGWGATQPFTSQSWTLAVARVGD